MHRKLFDFKLHVQDDQAIRETWERHMGFFFCSTFRVIPKERRGTSSDISSHTDSSHIFFYTSCKVTKVCPTPSGRPMQGVCVIEMFVYAYECVWWPTGTIRLLSSPHTGLSHWQVQVPVVSWGKGRNEGEEGEWGNIGGEERSRLVEKHSEVTAVYTHT